VQTCSRYNDEDLEQFADDQLDPSLRKLESSGACYDSQIGGIDRSPDNQPLLSRISLDEQNARPRAYQSVITLVDNIMTLTSGQLTDLGDQTATLDHSELAQLAERISHMWFRSGEPDELLRNLHATFIYEILVEFPREIQALPLYQIPSGTLECFTFILMHWPPLNAQGMFAQTVNETSLSMRFVLLMFPDFQQFLVTDVWLRQEEICRPDGAKKSISELYLSNPIFKYHKRYLRILLNASNAGNIITFGTPARDTLQSILRLDGPSQGESVQKPNKLGDVSAPRIFISHRILTIIYSVEYGAFGTHKRLSRLNLRLNA
jgi:hypothetical protein